MSKYFYLVGAFAWVITCFAQDEIKINLNNSNFGKYVPSAITHPNFNSFDNSTTINSNFKGLDIGYKSPLDDPLGLKINSSIKPFSFIPTDYSSVCYDPFAIQFSPGFLNTLNSFSDVNRSIQCTSINTGSLRSLRFSPEYCQAYNDCIGNLDQSNIFLMKPIVSKEYAQFMLVNNIHEMESIEKVNAFALANYDKKDLQLSCPLPISFDSKNPESQKRCSPGLIDDVFLGMQKNCNPKISSSCYKDVKIEGKDFGDFHKASKDKKDPESALVDFFTKKVESDTKSIKDSAEKSINDLATIINENVDEKKKMDNILAALVLMSKENRLDPILNFEKRNFSDSTSFKETKLYKKLNSLITNNSKNSRSDSSSSVQIELKKLRLELFKEINNEACKRPKSFNEICQNAKSLSEGKYIEGIYTLDNDRFFPKEKEDYVSYLPLTDGNNKTAKKNFFILLESVRCKAFNFTGSKNPGGQKPIWEKNNLSDWDFNEKAQTKDNLSTNSGSGSYDKYSSILREVDPANYSNGDNWAKSIEKKALASESETLTAVPSAELANNKLDPDASETSNASTPSALPSALNGTTSASNTFSTINSANNQNDLNTNFTNDETSLPEEKTPSTPKSSELSDKVDSLSKKLADSEAKMNRMNKENEEKARNQQYQNQQQEYDSQLETLNSQISNLQKENALLQGQNKNLKADQGSINQNENSDTTNNSDTPSSSAYVSNSRNDSDNQNRRSEDQPNEASAAASSFSSGGGASSNSSSISPESVASAPSKSSFGAGGAAGSNSGTSGKSSGITLTRIDDMGADKAEETIYALIETNNGKPFTVEEGGFIKEIIPLVVAGKVQMDSKTGKPVYQKVIKGKVADLKNSSINKASETTEPISSKADLLRAEEERLKRERVEYLKLKKQALKALKLPH